jgi:hypothetical protein
VADGGWNVDLYQREDRTPTNHSRAAVHPNIALDAAASRAACAGVSDGRLN